MAESLFRGTIQFFADLGIYDVVLPFLLVFAIVFAILEKTKVFGLEDIEGKKYTRKNINSIVAFVVAFLVVASTKLVAAINQAMANTVLVLLLIIAFLILVGTFAKEGEPIFLQGGWKTSFMIISFVCIVLIFLNALDWLNPLWAFLVESWDTRWVGSLILLIIVILFMYYITKTEKPKKEEKKE